MKVVGSPFKLTQLNASAYPNITDVISNREGYKDVEEQIIRYAVKNNVTLDTAIAQLEMEL